MICDFESPYTDAFGGEIEVDPRCQWCERSLVTRYGGLAPTDCPSCEADMRLEMSPRRAPEHQTDYVLSEAA